MEEVKEEEPEIKQVQGEEEAELEFLTEKKKKTGTEKYGKNQKNSKKGDDDENYLEDENEKDGDLMTVKPWLGSIKEPSSYYKDPLNQSSTPPSSLTLDFVYGYRSTPSRSNIRYLKNGGIVYHTAALGIVMDTTS